MPTDVRTTAPRRNPARPQHRGEQRRTHLLAALSDELREQSLAEVSVARVADKAGLGRSAFYFYFSSKNEAVTYLLSDIFDAQIAMADYAVNQAGDPRRNLSRALRLTVDSWVSQRRQFLAMLDARDADVETRAIWEAWLRRYEDFVANYIDDQRRCGQATARSIAHCLISLSERVLDRHLRGDGLQTADELHASVEHVWSASIFGALP